MDVCLTLAGLVTAQAGYEHTDITTKRRGEGKKENKVVCLLLVVCFFASKISTSKMSRRLSLAREMMKKMKEKMTMMMEMRVKGGDDKIRRILSLSFSISILNHRLIPRYVCTLHHIQVGCIARTW